MAIFWVRVKSVRSQTTLNIDKTLLTGLCCCTALPLCFFSQQRARTGHEQIFLRAFRWLAAPNDHRTRRTIHPIHGKCLRHYQGSIHARNVNEKANRCQDRRDLLRGVAAVFFLFFFLFHIINNCFASLPTPWGLKRSPHVEDHVQHIIKAYG